MWKFVHVVKIDNSYSDQSYYIFFIIIKRKNKIFVYVEILT